LFSLSIFHDSGNEYKRVFLKYLNDNDIVDLKADIGDHNSLGVIDRFSKTFKTVVSKYMTINDTTKYYPEIDKIIKSYNNTPHNSLNNIKPETLCVPLKSNTKERALEELVETLSNAGVSAGLANRLANIYAYTVDFFKIQKGDKFAVTINERYIDDSIYVGVESIEASYFENKGICLQFF
jgi:hypothetical protein